MKSTPNSPSRARCVFVAQDAASCFPVQGSYPIDVLVGSNLSLGNYLASLPPFPSSSRLTLIANGADGAGDLCCRREAEGRAFVLMLPSSRGPEAGLGTALARFVRLGQRRVLYGPHIAELFPGKRPHATQTIIVGERSKGHVAPADRPASYPRDALALLLDGADTAIIEPALEERPDDLWRGRPSGTKHVRVICLPQVADEWEATISLLAPRAKLTRLSAPVAQRRRSR